MKQSIKLSKLTIAITACLVTTSAFSNEVNYSEGYSEEIITVGSRATPRTPTTSPVTIDVVSSDELSKYGSSDLLDVLATNIPSLNVHSQPMSDTATMIRPLNFRGLPSDSTLVLVNGKRRHRGSVITFLGGGINDGAQGYDLSVIPSIALKQVEVLRDGAAAQYGSDAIAGVMNFALKDANEGGSLEVAHGEYHKGDGSTTTVAGNVGLPITDKGFANLSFKYKNSDPTSRSTQRQDAQELIDSGNEFVSSVAQEWGLPEIKDDVTFFANMGFDFNKNHSGYMFGNYSEREVIGGFYFRNPHSHNGIYSNDGGQTLLVGDLTPDMSGNCATDIMNGENIFDNPRYQSEVVNNPNCFSFLEMKPGGFTPKFGGEVNDFAWTVGAKGVFDSGVLQRVFYDVSASVGRNASTFKISNTVNASMGDATPTGFTSGEYIQTEKAFNFELFKEVEVGLFEPMSVNAGLEWRGEEFEIVAGDLASYEVGHLAEQGFSVGSNGFQGFSPKDAGTFSRDNYALYLDNEVYLNEDLLVGVALRHEDYSSFGSTTNYKLSAFYMLDTDLKIRASMSTGFRAPTVGQANVRHVQTANSEHGLIESALLPPTHEVSELFGGKELTPERSNSYAFGAIYEKDAFNVTVDYFNIRVKDRISQSALHELQEGDFLQLETIGVENPRSIGMVSFFSNDFDTTTHGIDVVSSYRTSLMSGNTEFNLAYNWTNTQVDSSTEVTGEYKARLLEDSLPEHRANINVSQSWDNFSTLVRVNFYGSHLASHAYLDASAKEVSSNITVDIQADYQFNDALTFTVGAQNLFNVYPEKVDASFDLGAKYYETAPFGFNGGFYYAKATYNF